MIRRLFLLILAATTAMAADAYAQSGADTAQIGPEEAYRVASELLRGSDYRLNLENVNHRIWYRVFGHILSEGGDGTAALIAAEKAGKSLEADVADAFDAHSYGFSIGLEQRLNRLLMVGVGVGGNWTDTDATYFGKNDISALFVTGYGRFDCRQAYISLEAGYGWNDHTTVRNEGATSRRGSRSLSQFHLHTECGIWWEKGFSRFEPYLGLRYVSLDEPSFTETGADDTDSFTYDTSNDSKTTFLVGARYSWRHAGAIARIEPIMYGGWIHEFESNDLFSVGAFTDAPTVYRVRGARSRQDRFFVGGGIGNSMRRRLDLYFRYTAEIANGYSSHTLLGGMNWNF